MFNVFKKNVLALLFLVSFLLSSCGLSKDEKEQMANSLNKEMLKSYNSSDVVPMFMNVDISEFKDHPFAPLGEGCSCVFNCKFEHKGKSVMMVGLAGFDRDLFLARMPKQYGDGKLAIEVLSVFVDGKAIPSAEIDDCVYVVGAFMNRNKLKGNE